MTLAELSCEPLAAGTKPLPADEAHKLARNVPGWSIAGQQIEREFKFEDFRAAMAFVNHVARLADEENHHPDIFISYSKVRLTLSTHKIGGLSHNDFVLAAKIDELTADPD